MDATDGHTYFGLDAGSRWITLLAFTLDRTGVPRFRAGVRVPSQGIALGAITSPNDATMAIEAARIALEDRIGEPVSEICATINGVHLRSQNVRGAMRILPPGRDIANADVARVISQARSSLLLPENREVLHEIPRAFMVDGQSGIQDPGGLSGYDLDVEVHYSTAAGSAMQSLVHCMHRARLVPTLLVAAPLAAAESVRDRYAHLRQMAVVSIGAETTTVAIFVNNAIWYSAVLRAGAHRLTEELSEQLYLPLEAAEELKLRFGHCVPEQIGEYDLVELPPSAGTDAIVPRRELARILRDSAYALADELCLILEDARAAGVEPEVLVITGGGAALPGIAEVLSKAVEIPVERGAIDGIADLPIEFGGPENAAAAGVLLWQTRYQAAAHAQREHQSSAALPLVSAVRRVFRAISS